VAPKLLIQLTDQVQQAVSQLLPFGLVSNKEYLSSKQGVIMAFYIHIGCELNGKAESNKFVDQWIHAMALLIRLEIMSTVLDL
jgi:hypothetical protein